MSLRMPNLKNLFFSFGCNFHHYSIFSNRN